jgi:putative CocE/NonD family hydrolase
VIVTTRLLTFSLAVCVALAWCSPAPADPPAPAGDNGNETPTTFKPVTDSFDYERRDEMIPMRDGVKLHTLIFVPRHARGAPMLLTRTPYSADELTSHETSSHFASMLEGYDNAVEVIIGGGYIRVMQDIRGKYGSEGDYVMNLPLRGRWNPGSVDESTDTYDTIDWLVKHVPESNGKVGILGISYDGFLPLMAVINPHPALKVSVPMNPMVDGWMGDDWFHNGAFRQQNLPYIYEQEATRDNKVKWWISDFDDYDMYMEAGSAGELAHRRGMEQLGFWRKIVAHPSYDAFWREQAMDRVLADQPFKVPMMLVQSLWDAEDIYGAPAVYRALRNQDGADGKLFLVIGPWHHGGEIADGNAVGAIKWGSDTSRYFEREILLPFLDAYLKDGAAPHNLAPVTAFESGTDVWRRLPTWPAGCDQGCEVRGTPLYLEANHKLSFEPPTKGSQFDQYVSDPAKPVPYRARPIQPAADTDGMTWPNWLADDQREASGRPDVLVFVTDELKSPVKLSGAPIAHLVASTTGTDADWVVKIIDVYPAEVAREPKLGGYQLMVSADIFRGRYRRSLETPEAITPNAPLLYRFDLPTLNHVFLPGHRIMVQVQSSWFPLYDRNPQTFVPNIFFAQPKDYQAATQRIYHSPEHASFIELPMARKL